MRLASLFAPVFLGLCALVPLTSAVAPVQSNQDKNVFQDDRYGFKFKAPKDWTRIPLKLEEQWQVAKLLSDKTYFYTEPNAGWTWEHKPTAVVIAFVTEKVREEAKAKKEKDEKSQDRYVILIQNPYKDYLDYMKQTYSGGGWFLSDEKKTKIDDVEVTQYEIKVEKLTRDGPKRVICWVFHTPEVDFAFHWEVLETALPKVKDTIYDTLKSFKLIPRTGAGLPAAATGETKIIVDDTEKMTPEQRKARRLTLEQTLHAKAKTSITPGWQVLEIGRFLVLNHTKEDYARRMAEHSGAVFDWLDQNFAFIGPGEYVRSPILRICKDQDEEMAFRTGGMYWFTDSRIEIVVSQDDNGFAASGWGFGAVERVNGQLLDMWLSERDRDLQWAMPYWLRNGLSKLIATARAKGKTLEFRTDDWDRDEVRQRIRDGKFARARDLMKMGAQEYTQSSGDTFWGRMQESGMFVRYLVTSKSPKSKELLRDYLKNLKATIVEIDAAEKAKGKKDDKPAATEKEEEEKYRSAAEGWKAREKQILDSTFERCFHGWTEKDWDAFEAGYTKSIS